MKARFTTRSAYTTENHCNSQLELYLDRAMMLMEEPNADNAEKVGVWAKIDTLKKESTMLFEAKIRAEEAQSVVEKQYRYDQIKGS